VNFSVKAKNRAEMIFWKRAPVDILVKMNRRQMASAALASAARLLMSCIIGVGWLEKRDTLHKAHNCLTPGLLIYIEITRPAARGFCSLDL
jgi:hypothetical protein